MLINVVENEVAEKKGLDISEYITDFLDDLDVAISTKITYRKALKLFNSYLLEIDYKAPDSLKYPTKKSVNRYKQQLINEEKSQYTINLYMTVIKSYFEWLVKHELYPENIAEQIRIKKTPREYSKSTLSNEQVKKTIQRESFKTKQTVSQQNRTGRIYKLTKEKTQKEILKEARDYTIYLTLLLTGMRAIELVRADIDDIKKIGDNYVLMTRPKGHDSKDQAKPLPPQVLTAIAEYLSLRGVDTFKGNKSPLITSTKATHGNTEDHRVTTRTIRNVVKNHLRDTLGKEIDFANISTHSLRHTFATNLYNDSKDLLLLQKALGHSSPTISQRYAHNDIKEVINATLKTANNFYNK